MRVLPAVKSLVICNVFNIKVVGVEALKDNAKTSGNLTSDTSDVEANLNILSPAL